MFNDFSREDYGHGGHEHGVRRGFLGVSFDFMMMTVGVASALRKKTPIFGFRRSKLDHLTVLSCCIVPFFAGTVKETVLPLILQSCDRALRVQDDTLIFLAQHFGKMCHNLGRCVFGSEKVPLISHYQQMSRLGVNAYKRSDEQKPDGSPVSPNHFPGHRFFVRFFYSVLSTHKGTLYHSKDPWTTDTRMKLFFTSFVKLSRNLLMSTFQQSTAVPGDHFEVTVSVISLHHSFSCWFFSWL
jgi:hypothetical protein